MEEFMRANIGASDFARHITISHRKKGELATKLFQCLLKRPFVEISADCFETVQKLRYKSLQSFMKAVPLTQGQTFDQLIRQGKKDISKMTQVSDKFRKYFEKIDQVSKQNPATTI